jgi:5-methylcytosine-specific restriction protein A
VQRYADWLKRQGHEAKQRLVKLPDHVAALRTDLFDITANELVEAKGSSSRSDVRMALGQVLDYSEHAGAGRRSVLLPTSPAQDMIDLLVKYGVSCIFEEGEGQFKRVDAAKTFCGACPLTDENATSS